MRVVIDYRPALRQRTGAGEYIRQLVRALSVELGNRPGSHITLTAFSSSWKDRLDPSDVPGVALVDRRVPVKLLNLAWHRLGWPPVEWLTGSDADVAHSPHPLLMPSRGAQVVTIHDLDFLAHPERTRREIRRDYPALAKAHAARADRIVVPSQYTAKRVQTLLDVPADRLSLCPPGAPDWSARSDEPENGYILFVGTLEPRKNVETLVRAFEMLLLRRASFPDLRLAGHATPEAAALLESFARPPLAGRARHLGYVKDEDRRALYEGALCLVIPSLDEGFGLPALEAMTLGVPVIAADCGSLPEVVSSAGLLFDPLDAAALASRIEQLIDTPELRRRLAGEGVERARAFTWRGAAQSALEAYEQAIVHRRERTGSAGR